MQNIDQQLTRSIIHNSMDESVVPVGWVLTVFYGLLAVAHTTFLSGTVAITMTTLASLTAATLLCTALKWPQWRERTDPSVLIGVLSLLIGLNTWLHFWLIPSAPNTVNFIVWAMGNGFVLLSRPWFYSLTLINVASWTSVVTLQAVSPLDNWGWFFGFAIVVSVLIHLQRQYSTLAIAKREARTTRRDQLLQGIISAPELFQEDTADLYQRVCEAACDELAIQRFGVWIASDDLSLLRRALLWENSEKIDDPVQVHREDMPEFFELIMNSPTVSLELVANQTDLAEALSKTGMMIGHRGLLISTIKVGGQVKGVTTAVANSARLWSIEDKAFTASLANVVAASLQHNQTIQLEQRAQQAERLESLGILAGGVAHDFNNLLAVIMGHTELMMLRTTETDESNPGLKAILDAGNRARDLSQQMLAYAGRAAFDKRSVDLALFVQDLTASIAKEFLGETRLVENIPKEEELVVAIDKTQVRQVLLNLLVNASNANATAVEIKVGSALLDRTPPESAIELEQLPERYHWIEISDNGTGMDEHTVQRIFDPFFSTRIEGTGLGLAAVLGILRAHKGTISVHSTMNVGTNIRVYLPQSTRPVIDIDNAARESVTEHPRGQRVVLIEDEPLVMTMTKTLLEQGDNEVVAFDSLSATIDFLTTSPDIHFDFAVIDLTLRQESGMDVLKHLRTRQPKLPTVIMSGYDAMDALSGYEDEATVVFLQKPYSHQQLWTAIKDAKGLSTVN